MIDSEYKFECFVYQQWKVSIKIYENENEIWKLSKYTFIVIKYWKWKCTYEMYVVAKCNILIFVNLRYLQLKLRKYKEDVNNTVIIIMCTY